jgi:hypothetical protein
MDAFAAFLRITPQEKAAPGGLTMNERLGLMHVDHEATADLSDSEVKKIARLVNVKPEDIAGAAIRQDVDWRGKPAGPRYVRVVTHGGRKKHAKLV